MALPSYRIIILDHREIDSVNESFFGVIWYAPPVNAIRPAPKNFVSAVPTTGIAGVTSDDFLSLAKGILVEIPFSVEDVNNAADPINGDGTQQLTIDERHTLLQNRAETILAPISAKAPTKKVYGSVFDSSIPKWTDP